MSPQTKTAAVTKNNVVTLVPYEIRQRLNKAFEAAGEAFSASFYSTLMSHLHEHHLAQNEVDIEFMVEQQLVTAGAFERLETIHFTRTH